MADVKVIGSVMSGFCCRVEWALKLKGVHDYQYIDEDLMNKSPILLKFNPIHKKVPVLVHGDKAITESLAILEYIDETWEHYPLLPQDPHDRAMARLWAKFSDEKCMFAVYGACKAVGEEKEKAIDAAQECLAFLETRIEGKRFFGGEEIGFLDLAVGWIPLWVGVMEEVGEMKLLDANKFPSLHQWAQHFIQIPLIKQALPAREKLIRHFIATLAYSRSLDANNVTSKVYA